MFNACQHSKQSRAYKQDNLSGKKIVEIAVKHYTST